MTFVFQFTPVAKQSLSILKNSNHLEKRYKAVTKSLKFLSQNPKHPSLQTHKFTSLAGPNVETVFEAYAEQDTPGAYRIFFMYGPKKYEITIIAITSHP